MEPTTVGMTMSTKIVLGIVGLAVVGGIGYSVATKDAGPSASVDGTFSGNVFSLMERGGDWKCTWAGDQDGVSIEGTIYVSKDRFRSESRMMMDGMNISAQAVNDGEYMYTWSDAAPMGMKFRLDDVRDMADGTDADASFDADAAEQFAADYDYSCERWRPDSGAFAIPSNITFTDFSAMMQGGGTGMMPTGGANIDIEALLQQYQTQ